MTFTDIDYTESNWRNDEAAYDRTERAREFRHMQDWQVDDVQLLAEARKEATEQYQWPITCDGSGILSEEQIDVDQTRVIVCQGCPACQEVEEPIVLVSCLEDAPPLWDGMQVLDVPPAVEPKPMAPAAQSIPWTSSIGSSGYTPSHARIGNGLYARTGRRA